MLVRRLGRRRQRGPRRGLLAPRSGALAGARGGIAARTAAGGTVRCGVLRGASLPPARQARGLARLQRLYRPDPRLVAGMALRPARAPRDLSKRGTPAYLEALEDGWEEMLSWSVHQKVKLLDLKHRPAAPDALGVYFVQHMYDGRRSRGDATHALLAVQRRLRARGHLPKAWAVINEWRLGELAHTRTPIIARAPLAHVVVEDDVQDLSSKTAQDSPAGMLGLRLPAARPFGAPDSVAGRPPAPTGPRLSGRGSRPVPPPGGGACMRGVPLKALWVSVPMGGVRPLRAGADGTLRQVLLSRGCLVCPRREDHHGPGRFLQATASRKTSSCAHSSWSHL